MNTKLISKIDETSNLAGINKMQVLLFKLYKDSDLYAINVFKVREVMNCPKITKIPGSDKNIIGIINIRNQSIPVIDVLSSINLKHDKKNLNEQVIITEFNNTTQAFLVYSVNKIETVSWENVLDVPFSNTMNSYLTGIIRNGEKNLIGILDVEKIIYEIQKPEYKFQSEQNFTGNILIADDSSVARKLICKTLKSVGFNVIQFTNGEDLLNYFNDSNFEPIKAIISDIEMPKMDGYTLANKLKNNTKTNNIPVILHTSLSGTFNESLIRNVKADMFISKFNPEVIIDSISKVLKYKH